MGICHVLHGIGLMMNCEELAVLSDNCDLPSSMKVNTTEYVKDPTWNIRVALAQVHPIITS